MINDAQLLQQYARERSESAFGDLVTRHLDCVYSAALRVVNGDTPLAQDVTQTVFIDLARQAGSLPRDVVLSGWLHRHTCYTAAKAVRTEQRRQTREHTAMEMRALDDNTRPEWEQVAPYLDESLNELKPADRDALVLRFLRQQDLRAVGEALGISEDAARKRVDRALEKLHVLLKHRGAALSVSALGTALATEAVTAAPAGLAATISSAVLRAGTTITSTVATTKAIAMSAFQKALISAIVVASVATPLMVQHQTQAKLRNQDDALRQRADQLARLQAENQRLSNLPALAKRPQPPPDGQFRELLRLRGEVGRLRRDVLELSQSEAKTPMSRNDRLASMANLYADRVSQLKQSLEANPSERTPELQLLTDSEWLQLSSAAEFDPEDGYRRAMSKARGWAENGFVRDQLKPALQGYAKANNGQFPSDLSQMKPYFNSVVDDAILQRWEIVPANELASYMSAEALAAGDDRLIAPRAPVNLALDMPTVCSLSKVTAFASKPANQWVRAR